MDSKGQESRGQQQSVDAQRVCALLPAQLGLFCCPEAPLEDNRQVPQPLGVGVSTWAGEYHLPGFAGRPSLRPHLQNGPVQPQQHLPGLLANAGQVVRQRAAEEQVAEAPAADHTGVSAHRRLPARPRTHRDAEPRSVVGARACSPPPAPSRT